MEKLSNQRMDGWQNRQINRETNGQEIKRKSGRGNFLMLQCGFNCSCRYHVNEADDGEVGEDQDPPGDPEDD